jgi:hypothetical protein
MHTKYHGIKTSFASTRLKSTLHRLRKKNANKLILCTVPMHVRLQRIILAISCDWLSNRSISCLFEPMHVSLQLIILPELQCRLRVFVNVSLFGCISRRRRRMSSQRLYAFQGCRFSLSWLYPSVG